jgi:hypothetical protein
MNGLALWRDRLDIHGSCFVLKEAHFFPLLTCDTLHRALMKQEGPSISDFLVPRIGRNKSLFFIIYIDPGIMLEQQKWTETEATSEFLLMK